MLVDDVTHETALTQHVRDAHEAWAQFVVQRAEAYFTDAKRGQERSAALTEFRAPTHLPPVESFLDLDS